MAYYLNPDGTFPTDEEGKPMFVTEAQFKGCCCNMCQWRRRFEWDCDENEWVEIGEPEWIPAEKEKGISEGLGLGLPCTKTVWGEIVNCLIDPRPELPEPPPPLTQEEINECCEPPAPCDCPCSPWPPSSFPCEGLLEQYSATAFQDFKQFSDSGCTNISTHSQFRTKASFTLTADSQTPCMWTGSGIFEQRTYNFSENKWEDWQDLFGMRTITASLPFQTDPPCFWLAAAGVIGSAEKNTGLTPSGVYSSITECPNPGNIIQEITITVS